MLFDGVEDAGGFEENLDGILGVDLLVVELEEAYFVVDDLAHDLLELLTLLDLSFLNRYLL